MKNRMRPQSLAFLLSAALLACAAASTPAGAQQKPIDRDLKEVTIRQLQEHYQRGTYTAQQVVQWHMDRIEKLNPKYAPLVEVYREEALAKAAALDAQAKSGAKRGVLWGVPVVIKGNTAIAGKVIGNGWQGYARGKNALVATRDATLVRKFEQAGAVIVGQSNVPDFVASDTTISSFGGRTGNAYDVWYSPGGSSGGSAVAVALSMAVVAQGSDTANSIRNPSSNGALVGVLPTQGLVSIAGIHPFDRLLDNTGPMARTVTDAALALDALAGTDPQDPRTASGSVHRITQSYTAFLKADALRGRRLGVPHFILEGEDESVLSEESRKAFMRTVKGLQQAGAEVVFSEEILPQTFARVAEAVKTSPYRMQAVARFMKEYAPPQLGSPMAFQSQTAVGLPVDLLTDHAKQFELESDPLAETNYYAPRRALVALYQDALRKHRLDGFVYPALQVPPNDERKALPDDYPSDGPYSRTAWVNQLGVPAVVVPAGFYDDGLPYGVEMSADFGKDAELLGFAYAFEQATRARRAPPE